MMAALIVPETYVSPEEQLILFLGACLLGVPMGILFDSLRLLRRLIPHHAVLVGVEDVIFPVVCGFLLLGYTSAFAKGDFRMYYVFGALSGFGIYECTLGRVVIGIGGWLCGILRVPILAVLHGLASICRKVLQSFVRNSKKTGKVQKNTQNPLQVDRHLVYNKRSKIKKVRQHGKIRKTGKQT